MDAGLRDALRVLTWIAAFGTALWLGASRMPRPISARGFARLALGLVLAALAARLGFWFMHAGAPGIAERLWSDPWRGYSALFVPLGPLATAPWLRRGAALGTHLEAALLPLPLALAVARLGCVFAGCCHAAVAQSPTSLEVAGLLGIAAALPRVAPRRAAGLALAGVGGVRLATGVLRETGPLGDARIPPSWIATLWLVLGFLFLLRPPAPASESS